MPQTAGSPQVPASATGRTRAHRTAAPLALAAVLGSGVLAGPATAQGAEAAVEEHRQSPPSAQPEQPAAVVVTRTVAAPVRAAGAPTYTVRAGDTVSHIAARTGLSQASILAANGLDRRALIRIGQVLTLPGAGSTAPSAGAAPATTNRYTVQPGDTVGHIAARAGTSVASVIAANGLDQRGFIRAGQVLTLPGSAAPAPSGAAAPAATKSGSYTVRSGDTLSGIAARSSTTVAALRTANPGLDSRGTIRVGQVLSLPKAAAPMSNTFAGRTYPDATVNAATVNRDVLAARSVPSRDAMRRIIADTARRYGVDPALALAISFQESGFNQRAVSPANAVGAMQVIPSSGRWASDMAGRQLDLLDPHDNATAGVLILRANLRAAADQPTAIAAYYQGLSSVQRKGMFADTRRYVANIQTLTAQFR